MKKYFTIYLPEEGEIKEGDFYKDDTDSIRRAITSDPEYWERRKDYQKIKLFLCSRDIEVGDEYYNERFEFTRYPNKSIAGKSTKYTGRNGSYKLIGEISPDALGYVKEGDEFDEEEWQLHMKLGIKHNSGSISVDKKHIGRFADKGIISFCAIKGPCGHFH